MRLSTALYSYSAPTLLHPWLALLKSTQLQRIARATGIQSSGTKKALIDRIDCELQQQQHHYHHADNISQRRRNHLQKSTRDARTHPAEKSNSWSILSIDMGIQNLAFAHLCVSHPWDSAPSTPELTAWHRLSVSGIAEMDLHGDLHSNSRPDPVSPSPATSAVSEYPSEATFDSTRQQLDKTNSTKTKPQEKKKDADKPPTKDPFSPDLYAANAYTLITSLLSTYRPTHILIERQRFRSGGGSAVQEWTLRVGVFEGMLHAVLRTLRHERGGEIAKLDVQGIEPRRVVRYWIESESENRDGEGDYSDSDNDRAAEEKDQKEKGKKMKLTARDVKKAKIDIVGRWLSSSLPNTCPSPNMGEKKAAREVDSKIVLADNQLAVHALARAYLRRWKGQRTKSKGSDMALVDAVKLDDLADCLLQGVAWVEWQDMRRRLALEGANVLDSK